MSAVALDVPLSPKQKTFLQKTLSTNLHIFELDERSEVYGLGATLYQALTGHVARFDPTAPETAFLQALVQDEPTPPSEHRAELPLELDSIALRALARKPKDRYSTAGELADALDAFLTRPSKRSNRFGTKALLAAALLLGPVIVLAWTLGRSPSAPPP